MDADRITGPDSPALPGSHLAPERLAALADEPSTPANEEHLASCRTCAAEVASYRSLLSLTRAERDRLGEPLTNWESLRESLAEEMPLTAASARQAPPGPLACGPGPPARPPPCSSSPAASRWAGFRPVLP